MNLPVLYSFRRCPYAMRARLAVRACAVEVELREVVLREMPSELVAVSSKATVPVLVLPDGQVIDESWDIVMWSIEQQDPAGLAGEGGAYRPDADILVEMNDFSFKPDLDRYKYADRYPEQPREHYRRQGQRFLQELERRLRASTFLLGGHLSMADIGVFPFIRQFALVDTAWFDTAPYPRLRDWLEGLMASSLFASVMEKYPPWKAGDKPLHF